jgi:hypothetical protein
VSEIEHIDALDRERFWSKVDVSVEGCWLWTAATSKGGYGKFKVRARYCVARCGEPARYLFSFDSGPDGCVACIDRDIKESHLAARRRQRRRAALN